MQQPEWMTQPPNPSKIFAGACISVSWGSSVDAKAVAAWPLRQPRCSIASSAPRQLCCDPSRLRIACAAAGEGGAPRPARARGHGRRSARLAASLQKIAGRDRIIAEQDRLLGLARDSALRLVSDASTSGGGGGSGASLGSAHDQQRPASAASAADIDL